MLKIQAIDCPLRVSPDDLAEIILSFSSTVTEICHSPEIETQIKRGKFSKKNEQNGLSLDYAKSIQRDIKHFDEIRTFLSLPVNTGLLYKYQNAAEEFQLKIIANRQDYQSFDKVLNYIYDILVNRDSDLSKNKILTRRMLFYMYWNCDIGTEDDA